mmetsp:Transcript_14591/g.46846  ORF Transcript_14591/g.46846 Transcript_14591/m.46846 type:complete len:245 (-) Transcript_14591:720-1454(-)
MSTYSRVRSDPMTVLASPPAPRSISTSTKRSCGGKGALSCCACRRCAESDASRVGERRKEPPSKTVSPPMAIVHCPRSSCGAALPRKEPTAPTMRPTLGSLPATAVLTSGELTTALPTPRASSADGAPRTATRSTCVVPSPLRATSAASWSHTRFSAASNSASASSRSAVGAGSSTRPLEKRTSESSHMPRRLSAAVTCPTPSSSALAIAHTSCRRVSPPVRPRYRSTYCGGASSGQCTAWYGR